MFVAKDRYDESGLEVALKLVPLNMSEKMQKDVEVGMFAVCEYLVKYLGTFKWENYFVIVMDYYPDGDLQNQIEKKKIFTEEV
jgi:serine/threonine protein kinase